MMKQMLFAATVVLAVSSLAAAAADYDPLTADTDITLIRELTVADRDRDRVIPLLASLPKLRKPAPVILFSHGLGGSRQGCGYLREHWAGRGYVAVFLQVCAHHNHPCGPC
jgi:predicted dienelactone hydrolase